MGAEAFARASVRWAQVRDFAVPEQWVRRVAMNLAVDGLRRARRRLAALARLGPGPVAPPISVDRVTLAEALRTLPRSYRQVLVLHHLLELPVEQVAREPGDSNRDGERQAVAGPAGAGCAAVRPSDYESLLHRLPRTTSCRPCWSGRLSHPPGRLLSWQSCLVE
jgi:hypothetical protein